MDKMSAKNFIKFLEKNVNWDKFWGVCLDLYKDPVFKSKASNMTRITIIEKSFACYSPLIHVDQVGYDFVYVDENQDKQSNIISLKGVINGLRVEMKMGKNISYSPDKSNAGKVKSFKMKNYHGENKTLEDFKNQSTFDILILVDLRYKKVYVAEDEVVRSKYYNYGDGVHVQLEPGDFQECNIGEVNPICAIQKPITYTIDCKTGNLGEALDKLYTQWILNR